MASQFTKKWTHSSLVVFFDLGQPRHGGGGEAVFVKDLAHNPFAPNDLMGQFSESFSKAPLQYFRKEAARAHGGAEAGAQRSL